MGKWRRTTHPENVQRDVPHHQLGNQRNPSGKMCPMRLHCIASYFAQSGYLEHISLVIRFMHGIDKSLKFPDNYFLTLLVQQEKMSRRFGLADDLKKLPPCLFMKSAALGQYANTQSASKGIAQYQHRCREGSPTSSSILIQGTIFQTARIQRAALWVILTIAVTS